MTETLGQDIRALRKTRAMTLQDLAEAVGRSVGWLSQVERSQTTLVQRMGGSVRDVLRQRGTPYDELDLGNPKWTDSQLLDFIAQHPILIQRPIVATPLGVRICRPAETVLEILPKAQ